MASKEWRDLELLVKKIESVFAPVGAIIKSPDHIFDRVSLENREVDVSIRTQVGSVEVLILVECRNRNKVQDVRWIEEIYSKHRDLGGSRSIAVSANSFSEQAIKKAKFYNIELRTFDEITDEVVSSWNRNLEIQIESVKLQLLKVIHRYKGSYEKIVTKVDLENWNKDSFSTTLFYLGEKPFTANDVIDFKVIEQWMKDHPGQENVNCDIGFNGKAWMETSIGRLELDSVSLVFTVGKEFERLTTDKIFKYRDVITANVYSLAEYDIEKYNNLKILAASKEENDLGVIKSDVTGTITPPDNR